MKTYIRKESRQIEAVQVKDCLPEIQLPDVIMEKTDWVVKDSNGKIHIVADDVFKKLYRPLEKQNGE